MIRITTFAATCLLSISLVSAQSNSVDNYAPRTVIPTPFRAIVNPKIVKAGDSELAGNELVIGLEHNGQSRAYPINQLTGPRREIINDTLGGTAIAATW